MDNHLNREILEPIFINLGEGDFQEAKEELDRLFKTFYDNEIVELLYKATCFWVERYRRLAHIDSPYEKGLFLASQWKEFNSRSPIISGFYDEAHQIIKKKVNHDAIKLYRDLLDKGDRDQDLLLQVGKVFKTLNSYEAAIEALEKGLSGNVERSDLLAELADCYYLLGEEKIAKILFREAFYIDPLGIEILSLESILIRKIVEKLESMGFKGNELLEWIPVYGVLLGVFNCQRELRPLDYGRLKQTILNLKKQFQEHPEQKQFVPRLINKYFWLIDYYKQMDKPRTLIKEALLNISLLDKDIYQLYVN